MGFPVERWRSASSTPRSESMARSSRLRRWWTRLLRPGPARAETAASAAPATRAPFSTDPRRRSSPPRTRAPRDRSLPAPLRRMPNPPVRSPRVRRPPTPARPRRSRRALHPATRPRREPFLRRHPLAAHRHRCPPRPRPATPRAQPRCRPLRRPGTRHPRSPFRRHLRPGTHRRDSRRRLDRRPCPPREAPSHRRLCTGAPCRRTRRSRPFTMRPTSPLPHGSRLRRRSHRCRTTHRARAGASASRGVRRKLTGQATGLPFVAVSSSELAPSTSPGTSLESLSRTAGDALRRALASNSTGSVLSTQVEEDLRSALTGLEALHAHLEDLVATLLHPRPTPLSLVEAADDARAQAALAGLEDTLTSLRRRLGQAAAQLRMRAEPI